MKATKEGEDFAAVFIGLCVIIGYLCGVVIFISLTVGIVKWMIRL